MSDSPFLISIATIGLVSAALLVAGIVAMRRGNATKALGVCLLAAALFFPVLFVGGVSLARVGVGFFAPLAVLLGLLMFAVWVAALVDCLQYETDDRNNRLIWVIIIVFMQAIGALLYWLWRRPQ